MRFATVAGIIFAFGASFSSAQQLADRNRSATCGISEFVRKEGWTIPGLLGAKVKQRSHLTNLPGTFLTKLEPIEPEVTFTEMRCVSVERAEPEVKDLPIKILNLWSFDMGGSAYAYRLEYSEEAVENGKRAELASFSVVFFYDLDGSGQFTLMKHQTMKGGGWLIPAFVPEWAKNRGTPAPEK